MRLTHSVTIRQHGKTEVSAAIEVPGLHDALPVMIKRGTSEVWLGWEDFNAIADLVWAHRPDSAIKDAEIVGDTCGALPLDSDEGCVLKTDHLPIQAGHYTHVNRHATRFNEDRRVFGVPGSL